MYGNVVTTVGKTKTIKKNKIAFFFMFFKLKGLKYFDN